MRCLAGSGKGLIVEVRRIAAGIEVISEAAVDGIGTRSQGCRKRLGAACGSQKLEERLLFLFCMCLCKPRPALLARLQDAGLREECGIDVVALGSDGLAVDLDEPPSMRRRASPVDFAMFTSTRSFAR